MKRPSFEEARVGVFRPSVGVAGVCWTVGMALSLDAGVRCGAAAAWFPWCWTPVGLAVAAAAVPARSRISDLLLRTKGSFLSLAGVPAPFTYGDAPPAGVKLILLKGASKPVGTGVPSKAEGRSLVPPPPPNMRLNALAVPPRDLIEASDFERAGLGMGSTGCVTTA